MQCIIQWIDANGVPTPDTHEAVGVAWLKDRTIQLEHGRVVHMDKGDEYPICAAHLARLMREQQLEHAFGHDHAWQLWSYRLFTPSL